MSITHKIIYFSKNKIFHNKYLTLWLKIIRMKIKEKIIREARQKKEFSQEYMAHILGVSQSHYSNLENGEASFDVEKLGKLLDVLDLNPLEVIEFSERQMVFINSSFSGNYHSTIIPFDADTVRKIVQEELAKNKS